MVDQTQIRDLSAAAKIVHEKDRDRFITVMMLPTVLREDAFTVYAFNHEVAKTKDTVSEGMLGRIRLQWWREAVAECYDGTPRRHEITRPLADIITRREIPKGLFDQLIDAREKDLEEEPVQTLSELMTYADATGGNSLKLAAWSIGGKDDLSQQVAGKVGTAWALIGLMRSLPFHLRAKVQWMPEELVARHGVDGRKMRDLVVSKELNQAVGEIGSIAIDLIKDARESNHRLPKEISGIYQLAGLTQSYAKQLQKASWNPYDPSMAQPSGFRMLGLMMRNMAGRF